MTKRVIIILLMGLLLTLSACQVDPPIEDQYYTVTFVTNNQDVLLPLSVKEGLSVNEPNVQKEGYQLIGWFNDAQFTDAWEFEIDTVNEDTVLYAKWEIIVVIDTLTTEEMLVKLNNSIYQEEMNVDEQSGLSDPSLVGVNQTQLENEIRYPLPNLNDFVEVFYVSDYGLSPENEDNTNAFRAMLSDVETVQGLKLIQFESGIYKFGETIEFLNISDLYIAGNDTEWLMRSWQTIMKVTSSENFHINDMNFDYEISPTISGTVASVDTELSQVSVLVNEEFDMSNFRYNNGKVNYGNYMEYVYDTFSDAYIPDANGMLRYNSTGDNIKGIKNSFYNPESNLLTLEFDPIQGAFKSPEIGKVVSVGFTMYEYTGFLVKDSKNVYMETVNIYTTPGMAFTGHSDENLYFNRMNIMLKADSSRLMTATADGIHTADTIGEIIISNSILEASHDDSVNIKTFYFKVDSVLRNKLTVNMTTTEVRIPINVGDQLEFFEDNSFVSKAVRTVIAVESYGTTYEITLDENLSTGLVVQGDLVGNLSRVAKVTIENSIFRNKRNRGILVQVRDSKIINSSFYNIIHGPIMMHAAFDVFAEAIVPKNVVIENNKFFNNNQSHGLSGDISVFRHGGDIVRSTITDIVINNNYFYQSSYNSIYLLGTGRISITDNVFHDVSIKSSGENSANSAININIVSDTLISGNLTYMIQVKSDFVFVYANDDIDTVYNNNTNHNINE